MTNDNNTPIDTTNVNQTPLNVAATDATVTTVGNITASTAAATTSTADETTRLSLFGARLYQTGSVSATASGPVAVQTPPAVISRKNFSHETRDAMDHLRAPLSLETIRVS
ncbi:hypothetical protein F2Q70_00006191 [Brassica cretica]|uniref:Uncharacterized protein n=1 Tax=Brassica cretica TaxID=69181 RepID=A0A8S9IM51_BRACR|nr:hypothetical protein F2Q68_00022817 [Brassica cretica]KAF2570928.1 hypothetical protein F2Q70_00006191 [Brassica cretica]